MSLDLVDLRTVCNVHGSPVAALALGFVGAALFSLLRSFARSWASRVERHAREVVNEVDHPQP